MKLPWNTDELENRVEDLENRLEEKNSRIEELESRLEAEQERRSKLSRQKQEAEEKASRLEDRIEGLKSQETDRETGEASSFKNLSFSRFRTILDELSSVESGSAAAIASPGKISEHPGFKEYRASVSNPVRSGESVFAVHFEGLGRFVFKTSSFFQPGFSRDLEPVRGLLDFVDSEKTWVTVTRGESRIYREASGEVEKLGEVESRVDRQHGKGGFSQSRFERKREEQVDEHLEQLEQRIEGENCFLLGDKRLTEKLPGRHVGGFDPNSELLWNFYKPRIREKTWD